MTLSRRVLALVCVSALFAPLSAWAQSPSDEALQAEAAAMRKRHVANTDELFDQARKDMAIVVIPTVNFDAGTPRNFDDAATRDQFTRQHSALVHWQHKTEKGFAMTVGQGKHKFDVSDTGPLFQTTRGALAYQVIPVWPGEYRLNRIAYRQPRTALPDSEARAKTMDYLKNLGMATLTETMAIDFKKEGPWTPLVPSEDGLGSGCEVTLRIGEGCNEAAREYRWVEGARRAFHNREAEMLPVAGVDTELLFTPLATITLEAGDVVLMDGYKMPEDQPVIVEDSCGVLAGEWVCLLESVTLERLPASIEDFRKARSAASFELPKLDAALQDLVYREPKYYFEPAAGAANRFEMRK
ncbi:hypothetical protein [Achromobacter sp. ACM05]|uniref:hypothetical protein n=1 Tax=Achromobacter sp. ACM05 TaxID=2854776 RepID=UPI001C437D53|nr:hypothetical protein [Achromobacter sp. ACM05]MBV7498794.1 hypothetical protein [Achromobacter sp. ACM05]